MKRVLLFSLVVMGFAFTISQGLLIRELLAAFHGNELAIGLILGNWLILEGLGSYLADRLAVLREGRALTFAALQALSGLLLLLCLLAAYLSRSLMGVLPGEGVDLISMFWGSLLILAGLAVVDGAMFAVGCRALSSLIGMGPLSIGWVYVLEALGAVVGGFVFTVFLVPFLPSLRIGLLLCTLNLFSAILVAQQHGAFRVRRAVPRIALSAILVAFVASLVLTFTPGVSVVQSWATERQWPGHELLYSQSSVYGTVSVARRDAQYTFYAAGTPVLSAPVPDVAFAEELVHLPLLFAPQPQRALVLSGGVGGVLYELEKYHLDHIDYAELDPLLIEAVRRFPSSLTDSELDDPRLSVAHVDGRLLVLQKARQQPLSSAQRYDVIFINLPYPSTLQLNRYYTAEFYSAVRELLADRGVLVTTMPGTLTYMSPEQRTLNAMMYQTLGRVFPFVRPVPGDVTLWLASPSREIMNRDVEALIARWQDAGLPAKLLTPAHIRVRFDARYLDWFWASLTADGEDGEMVVNRDLHPVGVSHGLAYWSSLFSPGMARLFALAGRLTFWMLALLVVGGAVVWMLIAKRIQAWKSAVLPAVVATTGFAGMAADLVVILGFQSLCGYVYQWIALLIASFMAGLGLGGLWMTRRLRQRPAGRSALLGLELALLLFWLILPVALSALYSLARGPAAFAPAQASLLLLNSLAGSLVGAQFPLVSAMWLPNGTSRLLGVGSLYASDLLGAFLGSILVSVILLPILGVLQTCLVAAAFKLSSLLLVAALIPRQPRPA